MPAYRINENCLRLAGGKWLNPRTGQAFAQMPLARDFYDKHFSLPITGPETSWEFLNAKIRQGTSYLSELSTCFETGVLIDRLRRFTGLLFDLPDNKCSILAFDPETAGHGQYLVESQKLPLAELKPVFDTAAGPINLPLSRLYHGLPKNTLLTSRGQPVITWGEVQTGLIEQAGYQQPSDFYIKSPGWDAFLALLGRLHPRLADPSALEIRWPGHLPWERVIWHQRASAGRARVDILDCENNTVFQADAPPTSNPAEKFVLHLLGPVLSLSPEEISVSNLVLGESHFGIMALAGMTSYEPLANLELLRIWGLYCSLLLNRAYYAAELLRNGKQDMIPVLMSVPF